MAELTFESIAGHSFSKTDLVMPIDVPSHIEKLIFLHDQLVLPTFGAFVAKRKSAHVDAETGTLVPPMRILSFDDAIVADDGLLTADISKRHGLSTAEASDHLHEWIEEIEDRLNNREIVSIPGIGRLYKNYVQRVQFLPDSANFSTDTFGLPALQFSPLGQTREVLDHPAPTANESKAKGNKKKRNNRWVSVLGIVLLICAGSIGGYWWWQQQQSTASSDGPMEEQGIGMVGETTQAKEQSETPAEYAVPNEPGDQEDSSSAQFRPGTTPTSNQKPTRVNTAPPVKNEMAQNNECILIIATLQNDENAENLKTVLQRNGYDLYYKKDKGHQVGVRFTYQNMKEIKETIYDLQKLTGERDIWIKKP